MRIVVLVKEAPDTYGDRKLDLETGITDREASDAVLDEPSERALEVALAYKDKAPDTDVQVLLMAPASAAANVRKSLTTGANKAVQVVDDALVGADYGLTAQVLAATLTRTGFDLVVSGNQSTDGAGGVVPAMIAELLDVPQLTALTSVELTADTVAGERMLDGGVMRASTSLPAVISVTEQLPDARIPNFKGLMAAKKKPVETLTLVDLGIDAEDPDVARSIMISVAEKTSRAAGVKLVDDGSAAAQLAEYLVQNRLA